MVEEVDVIVEVGSSNFAGVALLADVPTADKTRWGVLPPIPSTSAQRPYEVRTPGTRVLTPRRPYASNVVRSIATGTSNTSTQVFFTGPAVALTDNWVYIRVNQVGQGQFLRVSAIAADTPAAGTHRITVTGGTLAPIPSPDGEVCILSDAYRAADAQRTVTFDHTTENVVLAAHGYTDGTPVVFVLSGGTMPPELTAGTTYYTISTAAGTFRLATTAANAMAGTFISFSGNGTATVKVRLASTFTITKNGGSAFTSAVVGKDVMLAGDVVRRVTAFTTDTLTFDLAVTPPTADTYIIVLSGADACQTLADLSDPVKCPLRDLTFYLDENAPVFLTGVDYPNYDSMPWPNPRIAYNGYGSGPNINLTPELSFNLRARLDSLVVIKMGVSASMVSQLMNGVVYSPSSVVPFGGYIGWYHDIQSLDYHPSSPNALYAATVNQIVATKAAIAAEGKVAKFRGIFINLWDNDPIDAQRVIQLRSNTELLIAGLRAAVGDSSLPVSLSGPSRYGGIAAQREILYEMLLNIVENDANVGLLDTRGSAEITGGKWVFPTDYQPDQLHFSATGEIKLGQGHAAVWDTLQSVSGTDITLAICNMALSHIGERAKVTSLDGSDTSAQAQHCAMFYPRAVKSLMEQHAWDFNTRRKPLVLTTNPTAHLLARTEEWLYAYDLPHLPPNFGGAIAVLPHGASRDAPTQPFQKESDLGGNQIILTDVPDAVLRYNVSVMNPRKFSESFVMAVSWMLASMLAGPIIKGDEGRKARDGCLAMMRAFLGRAEAHDSNQRKVEPETEAPWMM